MSTMAGKGTGMDAPSTGKQGLDAFEDATTKGAGKGAGTGDSGTGPVVQDGRTSDVRGGKGK